MSSTIVLQADSTTLVLNGFPVTDFGEGDFLELAPVNEATSRVNAVNGGVTIGNRLDRDVMNMVVRVQKHSASDVFLNSALNQAAPTVFDGSVKEDFVRDGTEGSETYILEGGSITTKPTNTKNNTDGNALMEYTIQFRVSQRNL